MGENTTGATRTDCAVTDPSAKNTADSYREAAFAPSHRVALDDVTVEFDPRNNFCFKNGSKWVPVDDVQRLIAEAKQFAVSAMAPKLPDSLPEGATFNFEPGDGSITVNPPKK